MSYYEVKGILGSARKTLSKDNGVSAETDGIRETLNNYGQSWPRWIVGTVIGIMLPVGNASPTRRQGGGALAAAGSPQAKST